MIGSSAPALAVGVVAMVVLCGCSSADGNVAAVADRFESAVAEGDGDLACSLLAPATADELAQSSGDPCPEAVVDEARPGGDRVSAVSYGAAGQVTYADDVVFLARGPSGWQVMAASCRPERHARLDCRISGG